jgi:hypothetical protein
MKGLYYGTGPLQPFRFYFQYVLGYPYGISNVVNMISLSHGAVMITFISGFFRSAILINSTHLEQNINVYFKSIQPDN